MNQRSTDGGSGSLGETGRLQRIAAKLRLTRPQAKRLAVAVASLWGLTALLAFLLPVSAPPPLGPVVVPPESQADGGPPQEDLGSFMRNTRWGASLEEVQREMAIQAGAAERGALNPELRKMGFVGLFAVPGRTSILMILENGTVQRLDIGDQVPDGRRLAEVSGTQLTLVDANEQRYELLLFPKVGAQGQGDGPQGLPSAGN